MTLHELEEEMKRRKSHNYPHEEIVIPRRYRRQKGGRKETIDLERLMRPYIDEG